MAVIIKGKNPNKPYTVRYWTEDGRQREKSFTRSLDARDFKTSIEHAVKAGTYTDPKLGSVRFADYAQTVLDGMAVTTGTRKIYADIYRAWLAPWAGDRTLRQIADDREGATKLLNVTMAGLSYNRRSTARGILLAVLDEAVAAGRLASHRIRGIKVSRGDETVSTGDRADFVFPSYAQTVAMANRLERFGPVIWLMRGAGLRIREALAVHKSDFRENGTILRVSGQADLDGSRKVPLKHRRAGDHRDVPVPSWLWDLVKDAPDGPLCHRGGDNPYWPYRAVYNAFVAARDALRIARGYTPHSCRHGYATALLTAGAQLHEVSQWLGHQDTATTAKVYAHVLPSSLSKARQILDQDYAKWRGQ